METRGYIPPEALEVSKLTPPIELTTKKDLAQFLITFWRNNTLNLSPEAEKEAAMKKAKEMLELKNQNKQTIFFLGVKDGDAIVATVKLEVKDREDGEKHGYFSMLTVDKKYRGRGIAKQLVNTATEEYAKPKGCTQMSAGVYYQNPIGLVTEFNNGFVLTGLEFDDEGEPSQFIIIRPIEGEPKYDRKEGPLGELQEANLADTSKIQKLLEQGYAGIDIRNLGDEKDKNPDKWVLIMQRLPE